MIILCTSATFKKKVINICRYTSNVEFSLRAKFYSLLLDFN